MLHIHLWGTVYEHKGTATLDIGWFEREESVIARLERCERCGKERGTLIELSGKKRRVDPVFLRGTRKGT